ncbi:hypothetical protein ASE63_22220 [Bosea sp. Root381]|nr:hypothetical protein ASE63_22220 [Bosea sp. Root381]
MESHGAALVTARQVDPSDLAFMDELAEPGFSDTEIASSFAQPEKRRHHLSARHGAPGWVGVGALCTVLMF